MNAIANTVLNGTRVQLAHWRCECGIAEAGGDVVRMALCERHIRHCSAIVLTLEARLPGPEGTQNL